MKIVFFDIVEIFSLTIVPRSAQITTTHSKAFNSVRIS